jgi:hypothetical protein
MGGKKMDQHNLRNIKDLKRFLANGYEYEGTTNVGNVDPKYPYFVALSKVGENEAIFSFSSEAIEEVNKIIG